MVMRKHTIRPYAAHDTVDSAAFGLGGPRWSFIPARHGGSGRECAPR